MKALLNNSLIPLDHAVLCLDCSCVSDAIRECPACCSRALLNLSNVLNRPEELSYPLAAIMQPELHPVAA
jgi:hypothetical protein